MQARWPTSTSPRCRNYTRASSCTAITGNSPPQVVERQIRAQLLTAIHCRAGAKVGGNDRLRLLLRRRDYAMLTRVLLARSATRSRMTWGVTRTRRAGRSAEEVG